MMEGPRHQHLHQEWQEPLEEPTYLLTMQTRNCGKEYQVEHWKAGGHKAVCKA